MIELIDGRFRGDAKKTITLLAGKTACPKADFHKLEIKKKMVTMKNRFGEAGRDGGGLK